MNGPHMIVEAASTGRDLQQPKGRLARPHDRRRIAFKSSLSPQALANISPEPIATPQAAICSSEEPIALGP
nr:hypothetical protein CFP56_04303 [Quercus suber]